MAYSVASTPWLASGNLQRLRQFGVKRLGLKSFRLCDIVIIYLNSKLYETIYHLNDLNVN